LIAKGVDQTNKTPRRRDPGYPPGRAGRKATR
jgi:hypothetical protein